MSQVLKKYAKHLTAYLICTVSLFVALTSTGKPLPCDGGDLEFSANANGRTVLLSWGADLVDDAAIYVVERSRNNKEFTEVLRTSAVSGEFQYLETDMKPQKGTSYYRLKRIDENGRQCYSLSVVVKQARKMSKEKSLNPQDAKKGTKEYQIPPKMKNREILIVARDIDGIEHYSKVAILAYDGTIYSAKDVNGILKSGIYIVTGSSIDTLVNRMMFIEENRENNVSQPQSINSDP